MTITSRLPKAACFALAMPLAATTAFAQDECSAAANVVPGVVTSFDTSAATASVLNGAPAFTCGGTFADANDLWYEFTATADYTATIELCGSAFDTRLAVYDGDCMTLNLLDCNDDSCSLQSSVDIAAVNGTQYFIRVAGFGTATGMGDLLVSEPPPPPFECADAAEIALDTPTAFDTTGATDSTMTTGAPAFGCGGATSGQDVWFKFTAAADYMANAETCNMASFDTKIEVYSGDCMTLVSEVCNDDGAGCSGFSSRATWMALTGVEYFVRVGGFNGATGTGDLVVTGPPPAVLNDECADAIALSNGGTEMFDSTLATNSASAPAPSCGGGTPPLDVWYSVTPLQDGPVVVDTFGSGFDTRLLAYDGDCMMLNEIACNDDSGGLQSEVSFMGVAGTTYYIRAAGFNAGTGMGQVNAVFLDTLANDDCSGAISVGLGTTLYNNEGGTDSGLNMSCAVGSSVGSTNDIWYEFVAPADCSIVVDTLGSSYDTTIAAYEGDCMALVEVACDDDFFGGPDFLSQMSWDATAGTTYYIQVGGWNGATGDGQLNIAFGSDAGIADLLCVGVVNSTGAPGVLSAAGSLTASDNDLTFTADCLPAGVNGILVNTAEDAMNLVTVNNLGGGDGTLCIGSFTLGRSAVVSADMNGVATIAVDLTAIPTNVALVPAMAGDTYHWQLWYRDGMTNSNLTSAVSTTFQ